MIPKRIITIWLSDEPVPELIQKCNESKNIPGYENLFITLENVYKGSDYVNKCIEMKEWVRAADYLRLYYLNELGGIYLDADAELIPAVDPFEGILENYPRMFVFTENSGYINNGYIGSEAGHPFLKYVLNTMEHDFKFDVNLFWTGMQFFAESYFIADRVGLQMEIYNEKTLKEIINHHAMKSWVK